MKSMTTDVKKKDLWEDWILFKKNEFTNPALQLKKQGAQFKHDQYGEFTYRPSYSSPPSMQEFYEGIINGIQKRHSMGLYKGDFQYYQELQNCLHEFIKLLNFKSEILVEVFQSITNINLSKENFPNVVVPCASCNMYIYITFHCQKCFCCFYCDKTCQKNHKNKHETECSTLQKITPAIIYPLQVEVHCGGDLGENVEIYFQHEKRITLKYQGLNLIQSLFKVLQKDRWLKNNGYTITEQKTKLVLDFKQEELHNKEKKAQLVKENSINVNQATAQQQQQINQQSSESLPANEDELFLRMPCIQEVRVIFLNQGAILQDIIKEIYDSYTHYAHVYYFPI